MSNATFSLNTAQTIDNYFNMEQNKLHVLNVHKGNFGNNT